jgi:hypothetical protein
MKKSLVFLSLYLLMSSLYSQTSSLKMINRQHMEADHFWGVDPYNQFYFSKNNVFYKTENGKKFQFQDLQLGVLESVDLLNPLKLLLFYKEANTVVLLDNRLNEIDRVNFNYITDVKTLDYAGISKDNLLWIFNADLQQLELFNYRLLTTSTSSLPFSKKVTDFSSNYNFAWLKHSEGFSKYNINGSLVNDYSVKNVLSFNIFKNQVMIQTQDYLGLFEQDPERLLRFKKPEISFDQFYFNGENLYIYSGKVLYTYKIITANN